MPFSSWSKPTIMPLHTSIPAFWIACTRSTKLAPLRFRALPEDTLVLPSHGEPFSTLHRRLDQLAGHHAERLDTLAEACREPLTACEAAQVLFPRAAGELPQMGFTVGETLAHLRRLERQGRLVAEPGAGEAIRFRTRG